VCVCIRGERANLQCNTSVNSTIQPISQSHGPGPGGGVSSWPADQQAQQPQQWQHSPCERSRLTVHQQPLRERSVRRRLPRSVVDRSNSPPGCSTPCHTAHRNLSQPQTIKSHRQKRRQNGPHCALRCWLCCVSVRTGSVLVDCEKQTAIACERAFGPIPSFQLSGRVRAQNTTARTAARPPVQIRITADLLIGTRLGADAGFSAIQRAGECALGLRRVVFCTARSRAARTAGHVQRYSCQQTTRAECRAVGSCARVRLS
jgi:hypothetical protein